MTMDCVVDASVTIKLFLDEPLAERADALFAQLDAEAPARLYVPDLLFVECANILWKYVRRFGYSTERALHDVADLARMPLQVVPTVELAEEALRLALERGITAYDAVYVALSRRLALPFITADESLVRQLEGCERQVHSLGDWKPQPL